MADPSPPTRVCSSTLTMRGTSAAAATIAGTSRGLTVGKCSISGLLEGEDIHDPIERNPILVRATGPLILSHGEAPRLRYRILTLAEERDLVGPPGPGREQLDRQPEREVEPPDGGLGGEDEFDEVG